MSAAVGRAWSGAQFSALTRYGLWFAAAAVLLVLPFIFRSGTALTVMSLIGISIIFSLSYNILLGQTGLLSFGHAVYYGLGGYLAVHAMKAIVASSWPVPLPLIPLVGAFAGLSFAAIFGWSSTKRNCTAFAMISLGLAELIGSSAPTRARSYLVPDGCEVHVLAAPGQDAVARLEALAAALGAAGAAPPLQDASGPTRPTGALTARQRLPGHRRRPARGRDRLGRGHTSGSSPPATRPERPPHDGLALTGGAIGQGLPVAVGAAVACPDRPVSRWRPRARDVHDPVAVDDGPRAARRHRRDLQQPLLRDPQHRARAGRRRGARPQGEGRCSTSPAPTSTSSDRKGLGVPAERPDSGEELVAALERAFAEPGPHLIDAIIPPL